MKCFSFLLILFLNLLFLFSASNDDEFLLPKEEEVLYINSYELVKYRGKLQVIYSDAPIYAYTYFVATNIKEDEYGNPIGYENAYTLVAGNEISLSFSEEYIIFIGNDISLLEGQKHII